MRTSQRHVGSGGEVMPKKVRERPGKAAPPISKENRTESDNASRSGSVIELGNRFNGECPLCGKPKLNVRRRPDGRGWWVQCWVCDDGASYLLELAGAVGCRPHQLIDDPLTHLGFLLNVGHASDLEPRPLPTIEQRQRWRDEMTTDRLAALHAERGLRSKAAHRFRIGWDRARLGWTLEVRDRAAELVNIIWRAPKGHLLHLPGGARRGQDRIAGRRAPDGYLPLYPMPLPRSKWWLLVEGEWDALIARQEGLPAVTGLLGKQWHEAWNADVRGRTVVVAYDVGAEREADLTVRRLREAGADARRIDLGLPNEGDDICDWFVTYGRTDNDLLAVIRRARGVA